MITVFRQTTTRFERLFYIGVIFFQFIIIAFVLSRNLFASYQDDDVKVIIHDGKARFFHGGDPTGSKTQTGSCFCGKDDYCMCNPSLAIDVILTDESGDGVWLVRRRDTNQLATMGGFVNIGESTGEALQRELLEETGIILKSKPILLGVYSDPRRDKRRHTVSAVYIAEVPNDADVHPGDDVKSIEWLSWVDILKGTNDFFADHETILYDYYEKYMKKGVVEKMDNEWNIVDRSLCPL